MNKNEIDFVLIWVDNNDKEWLKSFQQHKYGGQQESSERFRDWDNLHYWFRAIEKNAPWVRKIHFVTCGHYPKWLNKAHPKLNLVSHQDYIDLNYLPTFSANPIEINLHKIQGLSEKFVFFNDDFFLLNPTIQEDFFKNDLPCDAMILNAQAGEGISHIIMNDLLVLNKYFNKKQVMKGNIWKWLNLKYGVNLLRSFCLLPWPKFTGFYDPHLPQPFLKSTFEKVWELESDLMNEVSSHKFRDSKDINQYLMRYWQLASGQFSPVSIMKQGCTYHVTDDNVEQSINMIKNSTYKMCCINDTAIISDFETVKKKVNQALEAKFPKKSSFEI